jgi:hypothetical protein
MSEMLIADYGEKKDDLNSSAYVWKKYRTSTMSASQ